MILPEIILCSGLVVMVLLCGYIEPMRFHRIPKVFLGLTLLGLWVSAYIDRGLLELISQGAMILATLWIWHVTEKHRDESRMPFMAILLFLALIGGLLVVSVTSYIGLFIGMELMALPIYALCAMQREDPLAIEASLKYFVMGVIASILMLYGMSFIYMVTKSMAYQDILSLTIDDSMQWYLSIGAVLLFSGLFFKFGLAPFHMWVPDIYQSAPFSIVYWIAIVPKIAMMGALVRLLITTNIHLTPVVAQMFMAVGGLSIAYGVLMAIRQTNIRRLIAYASITHMGLVILPLASLKPLAVSAAFTYMIGYALITFVAFYIIMMFQQDGIVSVESLKGIATKRPYEAFGFLLCMAAMAGIPPLVGFAIKLNIFSVLLSQNFILSTIWAISFIAMSAYYYMRMVSQMYFNQGEGSAIYNYRVLAVSLILVVVGLLPQKLFVVLNDVIGGLL